MRILLLVGAVVGPSLLGGCQSVSDSASELGNGVSGGFVRNADTYGTTRRVDVYGGTTSPSLPTIGAAGFGK